MAVGERLYRSRDDRMLAGVAAGVADFVDADPSIIRVVWVLLAFVTGGLGLIAYIVMAIVVPERPEGLPIERAPSGPMSAGPVPEGSWVAPDGSTVPIAAGTAAGRRPHRDPADRARGGLIAGLVLILVGGFFLVHALFPAFEPGTWWPVVAIGLGVVLIVLAIAPPRRPG
jgi:phage shock protein C